MTRQADPARLEHAKREGVRMRLTGVGLDYEVADRWLREWERLAPYQPADAAYWDDGFRWIELQRSTGRRLA